MINKLTDNVLLKLIKNNTGYSSKNFFLVGVTILGAVLLAVVIIAILTDLWHNGSVTMSWSDMGMFIGAISSMFATAGITKAWSEKYERLPGADGVLGTEDDVYVKKVSGYEYTSEPSSQHQEMEDMGCYNETDTFSPDEFQE